MSYRVEFTRTVFKLPGEAYALCSFGGDNNLTHVDHRTGAERIARRWSVDWIGDKISLMKRVCDYGAACEDGWLKPGGRVCKAEGYISATRQMLEEAPVFPEMCKRTGASFPVSLGIASPMDKVEACPEAKVIYALLGGQPEKWYGDQIMKAWIKTDENLAGTVAKLRSLVPVYIDAGISSLYRKYWND